VSFWDNPFVGLLFVIGYLCLLTIVWLLMVMGVSKWGRDWKITKPQDKASEDSPCVSICIPARNEEDNILACLTTALQSEWPHVEIIVVDDRSEDKTGEIARKVAEQDHRVRIIQGSEPPAGWAGKPWACSRAAKESKGAWILFIDADVRIHPKAVQAVIEVASTRNVALLSLFGTWILDSFWEKALIPSVGWLIRGAVDFDKVNVLSHPEAFANGQFILMRRDAYFSIGGHSAVRDQVLEDVRLAEVVKRNGYAVEIRPAAWAFKVRLYRSLKEIIDGYTKNLYEGLGRNPALGFGAGLFLFICALLPFLLVLLDITGSIFFGWELISTGIFVWLLVVCAIQIVFRFQQERFDGRTGRIAWIHPVSNFLLIWILLRSTMSIKVQWKGRTFVDGRADQ
jgi:chlorobactene glucosyltransferase